MLVMCMLLAGHGLLVRVTSRPSFETVPSGRRLDGSQVAGLLHQTGVTQPPRDYPQTVTLGEADRSLCSSDDRISMKMLTRPAFASSYRLRGRGR